MAMLTKEQAANKLGLQWPDLKRLIDARMLLPLGVWPNATFGSTNVDDLLKGAITAQATGRRHLVLTLQRNPTQDDTA